ncbi:unnamed protein product [Strongylus vulgaris]|uniref:Proteasome activator PA28 C-terminal domain-containing protein n=1 Tax=Strongylus vulgaris TaxID=40348 RepID=A0A3P7IGR7_STRVU|nr:unnamed protein product [Strongylus vulgaris]
MSRYFTSRAKLLTKVGEFAVLISSLYSSHFGSSIYFITVYAWFHSYDSMIQSFLGLFVIAFANHLYIVQVAKYPHVDDYRRAILDMDEKQFINVRLVVLEMRNHFSTLYDIITKNIEKIKKPRNSNMDMLY